MGGNLNVELRTIKVCLQSMVQSPPPEHPRSLAGHLNIAESLYGLKKKLLCSFPVWKTTIL